LLEVAQLHHMYGLLSDGSLQTTCNGTLASVGCNNGNSSGQFTLYFSMYIFIAAPFFFPNQLVSKFSFPVCHVTLTLQGKSHDSIAWLCLLFNVVLDLHETCSPGPVLEETQQGKKCPEFSSGSLSTLVFNSPVSCYSRT